MTSDKAIIFDSSTLISFSMNGLFPELKELKKIFDGHFIVTKEVREETVEKPLTVKRFELEALRMQELLNEGVIEGPACLGIKDKEISDITNKILSQANSMLYSEKRDVEIIGKGEASCLALGKILNDRKIKNVLAVDERTTRILGENPEGLVKLLESKIHTKIKMNRGNFDFAKGIKFIRSSELIYVAYKKGLINLKKEQALDALLYALKFKGCAISDDEIEEIKRMK